MSLVVVFNLIKNNSLIRMQFQLFVVVEFCMYVYNKIKIIYIHIMNLY